MAYFVVAFEPDVEDSHNFPQLSVHDAPAELTEAMPFWDDAVGRLTSVLRTRRDASFRRLAQVRLRLRLRDRARVGDASFRRLAQARQLDAA